MPYKPTGKPPGRPRKPAAEKKPIGRPRIHPPTVDFQNPAHCAEIGLTLLEPREATEADLLWIEAHEKADLERDTPTRDHGLQELPQDMPTRWRGYVTTAAQLNRNAFTRWQAQSLPMPFDNTRTVFEGVEAEWRDVAQYLVQRDYWLNCAGREARADRRRATWPNDLWPSLSEILQSRERGKWWWDNIGKRNSPAKIVGSKADLKCGCCSPDYGVAIEGPQGSIMVPFGPLPGHPEYFAEIEREHAERRSELKRAQKAYEAAKFR